uniref:AlNc14C334G10716 protein n=1 Tax=Albugo laibachii Nc14 TaxID=890382 RepID=F0WWV5_9STRA|nr:AlNc14C334G10716 [Albugo laibachii Nc14]|eukprot:CCA25940.1 AlNc14C334G10716 [Albugo laibachii Nc14]
MQLDHHSKAQFVAAMSKSFLILERWQFVLKEFLTYIALETSLISIFNFYIAKFPRAGLPSMWGSLCASTKEL